ncbi:LamG domain-containing protein [Actinoplanes sp. TBRC 11911]|uniref:laminin G domain-containing protein n=1 Tax=Actinoplanes sp. TBRC 11911 TaxID=2729386 RepID=UPI00145F15C5|nr:laminin G domain-containing protein [Actinoplanes sp. TBRC 11911]NMO55442.1 LamG domain-containing protein [Actinoplanes sp. TBRC 11911]
MKISLGALAALTAFVLPAAPASAAPAAGTDTVPPAALVARYTFDAGAVNGRVADLSGRAPALTVRSADQGVIRFSGGTVAFPAACRSGADACPRGLLEAPDDADLNPGTRVFRWSARVAVTKAQLAGSSNVLQKGVSTGGSQWKLQIGATNGRAQCIVAGTGTTGSYVVRSSQTVADGAWHKVVCQRNGTSLSVWVDNVQRGAATIPASLSISNSLPLRVGGPNFNTHSDMYHGQLDDVYAELG